MEDDGFWEALAEKARSVALERVNGIWWKKPVPKPRGDNDWGDTEIDFARRRRQLLDEVDTFDERQKRMEG